LGGHLTTGRFIRDIQQPGVGRAIYPKLVRSYAFEGLLESKQQSPTTDVIVTQTHKFLEEIAAAKQRQFPSIGYGASHRFKGKDLAGTALVHENEVIHAASLRLNETENPERMAFHRRRRVYG
jgi:hypothetical protein